MRSSSRVHDTDAPITDLDARFRAPLMSYFQRRVGSRAEAENLTQETFLRLLGSQSFSHVDNADAFVFRVASNLLRDRARSAHRWEKHLKSPFAGALVDGALHEVVEDRSPERVLIGKESLADVLSCLNALGERTRNIFILFRLEGMKQKDIAALYGIGVTTVEKHVMKAVMHLADHFGPRAL